MNRSLQIILAAGVVCGGAIAAPAAAPVARVLEIHGTAMVKDPRGQSRPAAVYGTVYENERITLPEKSSLTLAFRTDGHLERLKAAGEATVTKTGVAPQTGVEIVVAARKAQPKIGQWLEELPAAGVGGVEVARGNDDSPRLLPILNSTVADPRPTFTWPPVANATTYQVNVYAGADCVWSGTAATTSATYAGKQPLKHDQRYSWEVLAPTPSDPERLAYSGEFKVASAAQMAEAAELKELAAGGEVALLALAAARYRQHAMTAEALAVYERLAALAPDEAAFQRELAALYARAGRHADARAAAQRAAELAPPAAER